MLNILAIPYDGFNVVRRRTDGDEAPQQIEVVIEEWRNQQCYSECFGLTLAEGPNNSAAVQRAEAVLGSLCTYFNTGGDLAMLESALAAFAGVLDKVQLPTNTIPGELCLLYEQRLCTTYWQLENGKCLKVVEGQYVDELSPKEVRDELEGNDVDY